MPYPTAELAAELQTIARRTLVFVHQSVGRDLLQGIVETASSLAVPAPAIRDLREDSAATGPGILHARLGRNRQPHTKLEAFDELMAGPIGHRADAATVKLCYVDINADSDVHALFDRYRATLETVRARLPAVRVFGMTVPLTSVESGPWFMLSRFWAGAPQREANLKREAFNALLRAEFAPSQLFDIAAAEARDIDGRVTTFSWKGCTAPAMYRAYTSDGGHLNDRGRRQVAACFLHFLAQLFDDSRLPESH